MRDYTMRDQNTRATEESVGADTADILLGMYERRTGLQVGKPSPASRAGQGVPHVTGRPGRTSDELKAFTIPLGDFAVRLEGEPTPTPVTITVPLFGNWEPDAKMLSTYSDAGFEDQYGGVHKTRAFAIYQNGRLAVFHKALDLVNGGGNGPEAKPLRLAVQAAARMVRDRDWVEYARQFGRLTGRCSQCHRELHKEASVEKGIGPRCSQKVLAQIS